MHICQDLGALDSGSWRIGAVAPLGERLSRVPAACSPRAWAQLPQNSPSSAGSQLPLLQAPGSSQQPRQGAWPGRCCYGHGGAASLPWDLSSLPCGSQLTPAPVFSHLPLSSQFPNVGSQTWTPYRPCLGVSLNPSTRRRPQILSAGWHSPLRWHWYIMAPGPLQGGPEAYASNPHGGPPLPHRLRCCYRAPRTCWCDSRQV